MNNKKKKKREEKTFRQLPPGPRKLPLIGNLHQLSDKPHRSLQRLSNQYGPLMFLQLGSVPTLIISSADTAREIFQTHDRVFSGRPVLYVAKKLSYSCSNVSFSPYSKYWRLARKIMVLELLSAKKVQSFETIFNKEVELMIDSIASQSLKPVNLSELMLLLADNIICKVAFAKRNDDGEEYGKCRFHDILHETQELLGGFNISDFFPWMWWFNKFNGLEAKLEKNFRELDSFFDEVIEEYLNPNRLKPDHEDLIDVLLRVQKDPTRVITLNNEHIKGVLADIFIAGSDTSSATLVWVMSELIRNPSVMRKAQEEVREIAKGKEVVEEIDLSNLMYLKIVIKEALRLHPPAPLLLPRETTESSTILGYEIPAKTRVFINAASIAMDPKYWENPKDFKPERFLNSSVDLKDKTLSCCRLVLAGGVVRESTSLSC